MSDLIVWHDHADIARHPPDASSRAEGPPGQEELVIFTAAGELARYAAGTWSAAAHEDPATKRCAGPSGMSCPVCGPHPAPAPAGVGSPG